MGSWTAKIAAPIIEQRGIGQAGVFAHWPEIVGARAAAIMRPSEFKWPPTGKKASPVKQGRATLIVTVDSAHAMEAQMMTPAVTEAVNAFLGWKCVGGMAMRQDRFTDAAKKPTAPPFDPARAREVAAMVTGIEDPQLRDSLERLGVRAGRKGGT